MYIFTPECYIFYPNMSMPSCLGKVEFFPFASNIPPMTWVRLLPGRSFEKFFKRA